MLYYHNFLKHAKSSSGLMLFFHCWNGMGEDDALDKVLVIGVRIKKLSEQ